ncbi:ribosomal protein S18-alanine N-acetyltransferase [Oceaniserpentilla sp. 4NH20-0058]|uniref:ribosomal protein S18-alanine N-acetyltransferase n=1 Tax=Oceaniserpentilla sp. 4NH20-0058 TaxID=3127660 RepID=UPI0031056BFC
MLTFREMTLADIPFIHAIEMQGYDFPWSKNLFEQNIKSKKYCVVALEKDIIIGYAILSYVVGEAELLNLCIDPLAHGKGYAKALLDHLIDHASEKDNQDMYLEVRVTNAPAIHIYEQAGFNEIGRRKNYYATKAGNEDAILMALPLFKD